MDRNNKALRNVFILLIVFSLIFMSAPLAFANNSEDALIQSIDNLFYERAECTIGHNTNLNKFYDIDSKLLQFELNDRVQKFRALEKRWETKIVSMKSTPYIKNINISDNIANVSVYEWTFFDWTWQGNTITSGFGVNHDMTWSFKDGKWLLLKDSYDEGPLTRVISPDYELSTESTSTKVVVEQSAINTTTSTVSYNRNAAASYADSYVNPSAHGGTNYPDYYNSAYYKTQPNDCANFVSQSMHAGGAPYIGWRIHNSSSWWYDNNGTYPNQTNDDDWPLTWVNVDYQYPFMLNHFGTEIPISDVNIGGLLKGDIVYYDWDAQNGVNHVAVVAYTYIDYSSGTYAVLVDCHNYDYYHVRWDYAGSQNTSTGPIYHPIHIYNQLSS